MSKDTWHYHLEEHPDVVPDIMARTFEERLAIAKKISAVPELLAACQEFVAADDRAARAFAMRLAKAAIAKAGPSEWLATRRQRKRPRST